MLYAAYGSNLNRFQMKFRCPDAKILTTGVVKDYRLMYKGSMSGAYLTIEKEQGCLVPVAIWKISEHDLYRLDMYEGYPKFYYRKNIVIPCADGKNHRAIIYIMHEDRLLAIPNHYYVDTCEQGYDDFGFDKQVLNAAFEYSMKGGVA